MILSIQDRLALELGRVLMRAVAAEMQIDMMREQAENAEHPEQPEREEEKT